MLLSSIEYDLNNNLSKSCFFFFQYWHDPIKIDEYVAKSQFIGEINNEGPNKDPSFAENLNKLENFVMVKNTEVFSKIDPKL